MSTRRGFLAFLCGLPLSGVLRRKKPDRYLPPPLPVPFFASCRVGKSARTPRPSLSQLRVVRNVTGRRVVPPQPRCPVPLADDLFYVVHDDAKPKPLSMGVAVREVFQKTKGSNANPWSNLA